MVSNREEMRTSVRGLSLMGWVSVIAQVPLLLKSLLPHRFVVRLHTGLVEQT